jgi:hypothetical protein
MKNIKKIFFFQIFFALSFINIEAQNTLASIGGNATGSNGSVSYTVGQVVFNTYTGTSGSVAQGVQQAFEISVATGVSEQSGLKLACAVYPNPVSNNLILRIENYNNSSLKYELCNSNSILVKKDKILNSETNIEMIGLIPAVYLLNILENNVLVASFKIIKNH